MRVKICENNCRLKVSMRDILHPCSPYADILSVLGGYIFFWCKMVFKCISGEDFCRIILGYFRWSLMLLQGKHALGETSFSGENILRRFVIFPQTVCLTLGVLTVVVKGRVARSRWRTEFVAIFVVSCLHVRFVCEFTYFRAGRARRGRLLYVNFRSFRLFNFFDVHFSW